LIPNRRWRTHASLGGFYDLVEHLVGKHPEHINTRDGREGNPLTAALSGKHFEVAEVLHKSGAVVDFRGQSENTLLRDVSSRGGSGHCEVATQSRGRM
jgi:hypothetical protein